MTTCTGRKSAIIQCNLRVFIIVRGKTEIRSKTKELQLALQEILRVLNEKEMVQCCKYTKKPSQQIYIKTILGVMMAKCKSEYGGIARLVARVTP